MSKNFHFNFVQNAVMQSLLCNGATGSCARKKEFYMSMKLLKLFYGISSYLAWSPSCFQHPVGAYVIAPWYAGLRVG